MWRFPLTKRAAVSKALEGARGVRCSVEDLHPVPRAFLEVCQLLSPCARLKAQTSNAQIEIIHVEELSPSPVEGPHGCDWFLGGPVVNTTARHTRLSVQNAGFLRRCLRQPMHLEFVPAKSRG